MSVMLRETPSRRYDFDYRKRRWLAREYHNTVSISMGTECHFSQLIKCSLCFRVEEEILEQGVYCPILQL